MQPVVQIPDLNLEVKALVQPLGSENNWNELGDGKIEYHGHSIRVVNYDAVTNHIASRTGESSMAEGDEGAADRDADDSELFPAQPSPQVVMEDTISDDTPFVGENSCIVWNSLEQQLSLCIMFMDDRGYAAAWSALHAIQHKPYPPLDFDVLAPCREAVAKREGENKEDPSAEDAPAKKPDGDLNDSEIPPPPDLTYEAIINQHHVPPLGYIEKHTIACSIMENGHGLEPALFSSVHTCVTLLKFCHADLLEYCAGEEVYQNLLVGLESTSKVESWGPPPGLENLFSAGIDDLTTTINTALRLHHLKHEVLPVGIDEEVIAVIDSLHHRLHNELICSMLADESLFKSVVNTLMTAGGSSPTKEESSRKSSSRGPRSPRNGDDKEKKSKKDKKEKKRKNSTTSLKDAAEATNGDTESNGISGSAVDPPVVTEDVDVAEMSADIPSKSCSPHPPSQPHPDHMRPGTGTLHSSSSGRPASSSALNAETTIANTLHFLSNFFSIAVSAFARELMSHLIAKVFEAGLLEALSVVAQRFLSAPVGMTPLVLGETEGFGLTLTAANGSTHAPPVVTETQIPSTSPVNGTNRTGSPQPPTSPGVAAPASRESRHSNHSRGGSRGFGGSRGGAASMHSPLVEEHMITFLDATITRLNEKAEEGVLNSIFRKPILEEPDKYMALMVFVGRCLLKDAQEFIGMNNLLAFHLLGLHDDEGSNCDRYSDPDVVTEKQAFQKFFIDAVLKDICRGRILPLPSSTPLTAGQVASLSSFGSTSASADIRSEAQRAAAEVADAEKNESGGESGSPGPKTPLGGARGPITVRTPTPSTTTTISPAFIRTLEYMYNLTSEANRTLLTSTVLHPKSYVMKFVEMLARNTLTGAGQSTAAPLGGSFGEAKSAVPRKSPSANVGGTHANRIRIENLTGNVRFLRSLLQHGGMTALRHCTVDRDILKPYLQLYQALGGPRKRSLFHSTVLSLLTLVQENGALVDCQRYLLLRHRDILPVEFVKMCDDAALAELTSKIQGIENGVHMTPTPSRTATPNISRDLNGAVFLDTTPGSSEKKRALHGRGAVDEVNEPSSPESMEEVATFPPRLRTMIGRLSPTPDKQPSPPPDVELAVPKQPRKPAAPSGSKANTGRLQRNKRNSTGEDKKTDDPVPTTNGKPLLRNL